jgi:HK97 family phage major capsid protein
MKSTTIHCASAAAMALAASAGATPAAPAYIRREWGQKDDKSGSPDELGAKLDKLIEKAEENRQKLGNFAEEMKSEQAKHGTALAETKGEVDKLLTKAAEHDGRMTEIEQKIDAVKKGGGGRQEVKSLGRQFVEHEDFKGWAEKGGDGKFRLGGLKAVTSLGDGVSAGDLIVPDRQAGIIGLNQRQPTVRRLIAPGQTESNAIQYVRETGFTNNAAPVSEGGQKPKSEITFDLKTVTVQTIANLMDASRQILADAPQLRSFIDERLLWGHDDVLDQQLLYGDGEGANLLGIIPQAEDFDPAFTAELNTYIDTLRIATLQVRLAKLRASGIVIDPTAWTKIELTKTTDGAYVFANPLGLAGQVMWGQPVVDSDGINAGEFLVGAFRQGAQYFEREDVDILISESNKDNFEKNMVTIRCEGRGALAVYRPEAFVHGTFAQLSGA